jgi:DNA-binding CsgD family transcriptional regulator
MQDYTPDPCCGNLTKREREILGCIAEGLSSKQIADKLYISQHTVDNHRKNMLAKTATRNCAELLFRYLNNYRA